LAPGSDARAAPGQFGDEIKTGLQTARDKARQNERAAWAGVSELKPTDEALQQLPSRIQSELGYRRVDDKLTPTAHAMAEELSGYIKGTVPKAGPEILGSGSILDATNMRKRLFGMMKGAKDDADRGAAKAIYEGYQTWLKEAADAKLMQGNPAAAANMRMAQDVTKEIHSIFGKQSAAGARTPGRKLINDVLADTATGEDIINRLFSAGKPKQGAQEALELIKRGLNRYDPAEATRVWNNLRLANWQRVVMRPNGELSGPQAITSNIEKFLREQRGIARTLYSSDELQLMSRFSRAMQDVAYKPPNASGSGYTAAAFAGRFGKAALRWMMLADGPVGRIMATLMESVPFGNAVGAVAARRAVSQSAGSSRALPFAGPAAGAASVMDRNRRSGTPEGLRLPGRSP
jgi:hypothetical protein